MREREGRPTGTTDYVFSTGHRGIAQGLVEPDPGVEFEVADSF